MPKTTSRPSPTAKAKRYLEFIGAVHLSGLGMDQASFSIDRDAYASSSSSAGERVTAEITGHHEVANRRPNSFVVIGRYEVTTKAPNGAVLVNLDCTYSALFSLDNEAEDGFVERFAQDEARLVFWPYLRHFIADSTYRMSISPLRLPLTSEMASRKT